MKKLTIFTMQLRTPGGIERFVTTLANMLSTEYEVEIVANYGKPTDTLAFHISPKVKLTFLTPTQPLEVSMKHLIFSFKWHRIPSELIRRRQITHTQKQVYRQYLAHLNTDFIITDRATYNSLIANYYNGNAIKIATDHNYHQNNHKYINELLSSIKSFDTLVVATKELRDFYAKRTNVKCVTIPNPIPNIPTKKSPLTTKNLVSVGRLVPEKDYPLLVNAMSIVHAKDPEIHLTIIGDGVERQALKSQISSLHLGNTVVLTGWLPQNKIAKYYYDSSLFIMTSKTEAFGLVLTEAMSYGLPCLALSRASGARAQITKKTGLLLNTSDPAVIAAKITDLLNHKDKLQSIQPFIIQEINNQYSTNVIRSKWIELLTF